MIALWPHWFRPWWLLLLPLLGWLIWQLWHRQKRAGRWQMILPPAFHATLLSGGNGRDSKLPWVALGVAWLLTVLALLIVNNRLMDTDAIARNVPHVDPEDMAEVTDLEEGCWQVVVRLGFQDTYDVGAIFEVLARHRGVPVLARQGNVLVASFHPELTDDLRLHGLFVSLVHHALPAAAAS